MDYISSRLSRKVHFLQKRENGRLCHEAYWDLKFHLAHLSWRQLTIFIEGDTCQSNVFILSPEASSSFSLSFRFCKKHTSQGAIHPPGFCGHKMKICGIICNTRAHSSVSYASYQPSTISQLPTRVGFQMWRSVCLLWWCKFTHKDGWRCRLLDSEWGRNWIWL